MRRALALAIALSPSVAAADSNDLVLSRLSTKVTANGMTSYIGDNLEFRELASQLGVVLAPHLMTPADTLGFSGFQFTADLSETTIDQSAPYWRVLEGSSDPNSTTGGVNGPGMLRTAGFFVRKGLWFPVPSFEVGAGATHLIDSHIWTGQLYTKIGLHEGYHDLPIPSVSARGSVSRMMDQRDLDLTVASFDIDVSKHVGVGGTWRFDPYAGWNVLFIIPRSDVVDPTQNQDPQSPGNANAALNNFVFKDQANILRQRFFVGAKFQYYVFQLTIEAQFALAGTSVDDRTGTSTMCTPGIDTTNCDSKDGAKAQRTLAMSAGFDF